MLAPSIASVFVRINTVQNTKTRRLKLFFSGYLLAFCRWTSSSVLCFAASNKATPTPYVEWQQRLFMDTMYTRRNNDIERVLILICLETRKVYSLLFLWRKLYGLNTVTGGIFATYQLAVSHRITLPWQQWAAGSLSPGRRRMSWVLLVLMTLTCL